jgi:hypothetical protein
VKKAEERTLIIFSNKLVIRLRSGEVIPAAREARGESGASGGTGVGLSGAGGPVSGAGGVAAVGDPAGRRDMRELPGEEGGVGVGLEDPEGRGRAAGEPDGSCGRRLTRGEMRGRDLEPVEESRDGGGSGRGERGLGKSLGSGLVAGVGVEFWGEGKTSSFGPSKRGDPDVPSAGLETSGLLVLGSPGTGIPTPDSPETSARLPLSNSEDPETARSRVFLLCFFFPFAGWLLCLFSRSPLSAEFSSPAAFFSSIPFPALPFAPASAPLLGFAGVSPGSLAGTSGENFGMAGFVLLLLR